jgi:hypothetical protein
MLVGAGVFEPTEAHATAKAKLYAWLDARKGLVGIETLTQDELGVACGTRRVLDWLKDAEFASWLYERDAFGIKVQALKEAALAVLRDVALGEDGATATKDRLKAAELLLILANAFPAKTKEVKFLDRDLNEMPEHDVDRQLVEARKKLGLTPGGKPV